MSSNLSGSGLREKPKNTLRIVAAVAAILWAAAIFIGSSIEGGDFPTHPGFLNYVVHFFEYLVLAVLITVALNSPRRALFITALVALLITSLYAASDEVHQLFVKGRLGDPLDWLTDTGGALVGCVATIWFISSKKVKAGRSNDSILGASRNRN